VKYITVVEKFHLNMNTSKLAKETAKNAVESIDGLKGYVGVDMILDE
jgi:predicted ATP-grasp superfamily ATP-dependent carboligase